MTDGILEDEQNHVAADCPNERLVMTDTERLDFLESLLLRKKKLTRKEFWLGTDIHIDGGRCMIYARTGIGSNIEFDGIGDSVREAIDDAIANAAKS